MKTPLIFVSTILLVFAMGCAIDKKPVPLTKQTSEGVALYGCEVHNGLIENTNNHPVRIRTVWQYSGEKTLSINLLAPGAKLSLSKVDWYNGFYVYTMDGTMVGFLSGRCP